MQAKQGRVPLIKANHNKQSYGQALSPIPDKIYFNISEVSDLCSVKPYVLRYWEQEFPQLKPLKRRGNRRFYQRQDIMMIRQIRRLLYEEGFTIEGARLKLTQILDPKSTAKKNNDFLQKMIAELESVLHNLQLDLRS